MLITASNREGLLFSPFCNEWWWQIHEFVVRMLLCLWSWKWRALAGFRAKWWFAMDNTREICTVFQSNAALIHKNSVTVLLIRGVWTCVIKHHQDITCTNMYCTEYYGSWLFVSIAHSYMYTSWRMPIGKLTYHETKSRTKHLKKPDINFGQHS